MSDDGWGDDNTDNEAVTAEGDGAETDPQDGEGGGGGRDNKCRNCRQVRVFNVNYQVKPFTFNISF